MTCTCTICNTEADGKAVRIATLTFFRREILYDVANLAYVEGDTMQPDEENSRHLVFDIVEEGNVDRATRVLNLAHTEVLELLHPFTKVDVDDGRFGCDTFAEPEDYMVRLTLPQGFSDTTVELLKNLIHEYLVFRVLADWLGIVKPSSLALWMSRLEELKAKIRQAANKRTGRTRRGWSPF